jgi:hypothetical protein
MEIKLMFVLTTQRNYSSALIGFVIIICDLLIVYSVSAGDIIDLINRLLSKIKRFSYCQLVEGQLEFLAASVAIATIQLMSGEFLLPGKAHMVSWTSRGWKGPN